MDSLGNSLKRIYLGPSSAFVTFDTCALYKYSYLVTSILLTACLPTTLVAE